MSLSKIFVNTQDTGFEGIPLQQMGLSTTVAMSQKAVTDILTTITGVELKVNTTSGQNINYLNNGYPFYVSAGEVFSLEISPNEGADLLDLGGSKNLFVFCKNASNGGWWAPNLFSKNSSGFLVANVTPEYDIDAISIGTSNAGTVIGTGTIIVRSEGGLMKIKNELQVQISANTTNISNLNSDIVDVADEIKDKTIDISITDGSTNIDLNYYIPVNLKPGDIVEVSLQDTYNILSGTSAIPMFHCEFLESIEPNWWGPSSMTDKKLKFTVPVIDSSQRHISKIDRIGLQIYPSQRISGGKVQLNASIFGSSLESIYDVTKIIGTTLNIDVIEGHPVTYGSFVAPCKLGIGRGFMFQIVSGAELLGDSTKFLYCQGAYDSNWWAPSAFYFENGVYKADGFWNVPIKAISFATTSVVGTGTVKIKFVGVIDQIQKDIEEIKSKGSNDNKIFNYNNIPFNQAQISEFLLKYKKKITDDFNQINVALAGDSIFGRMYGTELPYTPDMNNPTETAMGYQTGHFPPNMWCQNVAYKVLEYLQYKHNDVKYYNNIASEVTKVGSWSDNHNNTDGIYITSSSTIGDNIKLVFSGATYLKLIFCDYGVTSRGAKIKVSFSTDNGLTWKTPSELSLVERTPSDDNNGNGIYTLSYSKLYKFNNLVWKGFLPNVSYIVKVELQTVHSFAVWGFETWSNPRINVIVTAEGGNTASSQEDQPNRFYSSVYDQDLVIYELPFLNDLGTGVITSTYYKGVATTTLTPVSSPDVNTFYYVENDGIYNNFANELVAYNGDCIQWNGSSWEVGSNFLDNVFNSFYVNNEKIFKFLSKMGVAVLTLTTHGSKNDYINRPFSNEIGLPILRGLVKKYGLANIDVWSYHIDVLENSNIWSDGTHLNSNGVKMYADLISSVVTIDNYLLGAAFAKENPKPLIGESSSDNVSFGFEFKKVPNVIIYNSNSRVVTNVTKDGFTTSGSGSYKYEVVV